MRWPAVGTGRCWFALGMSVLVLLLIGHRGLLRAQDLTAQPQAVSGPCTGTIPITHARRVATRGAQVLSDEMVALPDSLPMAWRNERVALRYEIDVSRCAGSPSAALSLYRVGAPYVVNALDAPIESLHTSHWYELTLHDAIVPEHGHQIFNGRIPNLLALPPAARTAEIRLLTLPYIPVGLATVELGPTNALLSTALANVGQVVGYTDAAAGVMLVLALMAGVLWLQRRHDLAFLWMTLACLSWSVRALAFYDRNVYISPIWFEQFNSFNILLTAVALCAATLTTIAQRRPTDNKSTKRDWRRTPRQVLLFAIVSSTVALALSVLLDSGAMLARAYAQSWALGLSLATIWWIWSKRIWLSRLHRCTTIAAYVGLIASAAHDMALVTGTIASTGPSYLFWGFTVVLVVYALISGDYIISTLNRAENSNLELEQRVASKSSELEESYQQLRKTEMAGALSSARLQERERLLRDMHDGLGAQLMTALRGVERSALSPEQIAQSLQDGMDELRMLMDSAEIGTDLSSALAAWRNRWDNRLGAAGVQLHWHMDDSIDGLQLDGDVVLQITRILQEAATNVVKHAHARNLHLRARLLARKAQTWLVIDARDDGHGLPQQDTLRSQHGLRNMEHRARQIGARIGIASYGDPTAGCRVLLELRIDPPPMRPERRRQPRTTPTGPGAIS